MVSPAECAALPCRTPLPHSPAALLSGARRAAVHARHVTCVGRGTCRALGPSSPHPGRVATSQRTGALPRGAHPRGCAPFPWWRRMHSLPLVEEETLPSLGGGGCAPSQGPCHPHQGPCHPHQEQGTCVQHVPHQESLARPPQPLLTRLLTHPPILHRPGPGPSPFVLPRCRRGRAVAGKGAGPERRSGPRARVRRLPPERSGGGRGAERGEGVGCARSWQPAR